MKRKTVIFCLIIVLGIVLFYSTGLSQELQNVSKMQAWFHSQGSWGYLTFIVICVVTAVFMLPGGLLAIIAGIAFGGWTGGLLTAIGSTIGASISFLLGKTMLKDSIIARYGNNKTFKQIMNGVKQNGTEFLILTRMVPIFPYAIQSYAYALTPMRFWKFSIISGITMMPACFIYAIFASDILTKGLSLELSIKFTIMGVILFLLTYVPKKVAQRRHLIK